MSMIGKSLAHYEITGLVGKGGMGEVYQAKDKKLGRDVAIKVLPEEFALDPDRVARFQREAKLLASLNHPNIAAIHGLEDSDGTSFLVMELVEGETLADRIKKGPIPVEESLKLAIQITEALEAAHEKGIIHRDLKPANIKITPEGKVKVLDFGLAKAFTGETTGAELSNSPTLSDAATRLGIILGTAAYMSPEQATGKSVDKRADIWAFAVVLFEMLTGKKLFEGDTVTETIAGVIKGEPAWKSLPPELHPRIRFMLERCLKKVPKNRYSGINDARVDIQEVLSDPSGLFAQPVSHVEPRKNIQTKLSLITAVMVLTAIIVGVVVWYLKPPEPRKVMRFSYELPENQQFIPSAIQFAISPDGSQFVYLTTDGFFLRSPDAFDARHVAGTDPNSRQPAFSPDGKWIAYWSSNDRKLKKVAISGGVPVILCDTGAYFGGLSWNPDNTIVYSDMAGGGIKRVSGDGGTPVCLIEAELAKATTDGIPTAPQMLPDGKTLLFTNVFSPSNYADRQITVQSFESGERKVLVGGLDAIYLTSGHLVYVQVSNNVASVVAVAFDLDTMEVKGGPVPLIESVRGGAISESGTIVYVPGTSGSGSAPLRTLVWVDKEGKEEQIGAEPNRFQFPKISPDGTKVALSVERDGNIDVWVWDLIRENLNRLTFDEAEDITPMWTPDGKRMVFASGRDGVISIFWKAADGTGEVEKIGSLPDQRLYPWSWSSDGKTLVTAEMDLSLTDVDIGAISMEGNGERKSLLKTDHVESHPRISPDGRWMAYFSNETGDLQVFVRPFPEVDQGKWQVSVDGGQSPLWSPDGHELYYLNEDAIMATEVNTEPTFSASKPKILFRGNYVTGYAENPEWDISPDGKRFLMIKPPGTSDDSAAGTPRRINIVLNWDEELKQRVPVD